MISVNGEIIEIKHFPDGTLLIKPDNIEWEHFEVRGCDIVWKYENDEELVALIFLTKHLRTWSTKDINLIMPYIPNARQDRVHDWKDVFTLKYFAEIINSLNFDNVYVLDPHSHVSEALFDRVQVEDSLGYVQEAIRRLRTDLTPLMLFFPDEGAMKRYSSYSKELGLPYAFGIKERDWDTGKILGLQVAGNTEGINGSNVLIVDDICSRGGTFYHSAKKLKELGADKIYLYVSHCENTILKGDLLDSGLIERVYTTDSIFTGQDDRIEVLKYEC